MSIRFTAQQVLLHNERVARGRRGQTDSIESNPLHEAREIGPTGLHKKVLDWCNSQWPRWVVIHARTDKKSTLPEGCHDLTVLGPKKKFILIELKSATGKRNRAQQIWAAQCLALDHEVKIVRSMDEFLKEANPVTQK